LTPSASSERKIARQQWTPALFVQPSLNTFTKERAAAIARYSECEYIPQFFSHRLFSKESVQMPGFFASSS